MAHITALEAGSRVAGVLCSSATAVRKLDANFVAHEMAFVILGDAFLRSLAAIEFLRTGFREGSETRSEQRHTTKPYPILKGFVETRASRP
jgi:hypothetical protein